MLTRLFGGLVLFLLAVVAASGLLLTLHYEPSTAPILHAETELIPEVALSPGTSAAWYSTEVGIMRKVEFGSLVRSVHRIGVGLLFASLLLFLVSLVIVPGRFTIRGKDRNGEGRVWRTSALLTMLLLGSAFTGSILPWNVRSFAAAEVVAGFAENSIPIVGRYSAALLRGSETVGGPTLGRAYVLHIAWFPLMIAILLFTLAPWRRNVIGQNASQQENNPSTRGDILVGSIALLGIVAEVTATGSLDTSSPLILLSVSAVVVSTTHLILSAIRVTEKKYPAVEIWGHLLCWLLMMGVIITIASLTPNVSLGVAGGPMDIGSPPVHIEGLHPEWYLMFGYGAVRVFSGSIALVIFIGLTLLMLLSPSLEQRFGNGSGRIVRIAGIILLIVLFTLTVWGYASLP